MNYVIYTTEGWTQTPNGDDINNCQILAFETAVNKIEAKNAFLNKYKHLFINGFSEESIVIRQII